jgi:hypothetical protein
MRVLRLMLTAFVAISVLLAWSAGTLAADDPVASPTPEQDPEATPTPTASPAPESTPTPSPTPFPTPDDEVIGAGVSAYPVVDRDGDPSTETDWLQGLPGWEFDATFGTAQVVGGGNRVTDELGSAWWFITYTADTPVTITEHVPDGYTLIDVKCEWAETDESPIDPLSTTLDRDTVSWMAVVGTGNYHDFWCFFVNSADGSEPLPTLPPTDTASHSASDPD